MLNFIFEYEKRSKKEIKFPNFNELSNLHSDKDFQSPDFNTLNIHEEFERFPKQKILDKPKRMRFRLGLSINSFLSGSSSDDKYKILQRAISKNQGNTSNSSIDMEGWFTSSSNKKNSSSGDSKF